MGKGRNNMAKRKTKIEIEESSGNVFEDLGFPNPDQELLKARLTLQIYRVIKQRKLTQTQAGEIMFERPLLTPFYERTNRRRRRVENVDAVTFDDGPEAIRLRPIRRAFIHQRGGAIR